MCRSRFCLLKSQCKIFFLVFEKLWQNYCMEAFIITNGRSPYKDFKISFQKLEIMFLHCLLKIFEFLLLLVCDVFSITLNLNLSINYFCKLNLCNIFGIYMARDLNVPTYLLDFIKMCLIKSGWSEIKYK